MSLYRGSRGQLQQQNRSTGREMLLQPSGTLVFSDEASQWVSVPMAQAQTENSELGAGNASIPPLQPVVVPLPEQWHPSGQDDRNVVGDVYDIDALVAPGFLSREHPFRPPGEQATGRASRHEPDAGASASGPQQPLGAPLPRPSTPPRTDAGNAHGGVSNNVNLSSSLVVNDDMRGEEAGNSVMSSIENKCVVCLTHDPDVVLLPCGHLCLCEGCAGAIDRCPLCRRDVQDTKHAYRS
jgi:hypothetical protein